MQRTDLGVFPPAHIAPHDLRPLVTRLDDEGFHSVWFTETDLVAQRVAAGTPAQCADRIREYLDAGVWPVALYNRDPSSLLDQLTRG